MEKKKTNKKFIAIIDYYLEAGINPLDKYRILLLFMLQLSQLLAIYQAHMLE